jgi:hypothetical protein
MAPSPPQFGLKAGNPTLAPPVVNAPPSGHQVQVLGGEAAFYPKSGNTWTRAFLHNLVHVTSGQAQAQQINDLNQFSMTSAAKFLFEEVLGFLPTDKHREQIAAARARAQQRLAELVEGLIFVKTHQALAIDRGHPTINFSVTVGAIYIVRNPLDVAISYAHHLGRSLTRRSI